MTSFVRMLGGALLLALTGCTAPGLLNSVDGISGGGKLLLKFDTAVEVRGGHVGRFDATIKADSKAWLTVNRVNATLSATASGDVEVRKYLSFCAILY